MGKSIAKQRLSKRNRICRPPKYPGKPHEYIYVSEHCRRNIPQRRQRMISRSRNPDLSMSYSQKDVVIASLLKRIEETPVFILTATKAIKQGMSYETACEKWRGKVDFKNSRDIKDVIASLIVL